MGMPGRMYSATNGYRYGFNGKENDPESNTQDYGMRIYDPRIGRFLSVDPLTREYPHYTPYSFAGNKPIAFIDRDGEEESLEIATRRREEAYLSGKITAEEYRAQTRASGLAGIIGGTIVLDVFVTKGYITYTLLASQALGMFEHNRAKTPEGRAAQDQRIKENVTDLFINVGTGSILNKVIGVTTRIFSETGKYVYKTFKSTSIRYSQTSVNGLDEIVANMKQNGWKGEPIDIVKMEDNIYTTVDNTRLLAAQKAGIDVQAVAHNFDDAISEELAKRFVGKDGILPKTWGEAVKNRIQSQNKQFRTTNENGSFVEPQTGKAAEN